MTPVPVASESHERGASLVSPRMDISPIVQEFVWRNVAVAIGEEVVWSTSPPIPTAAGYFSEDITVESDHPRGTPVVVHLHNHGQNTYGVKALQRL